MKQLLRVSLFYMSLLLFCSQVAIASGSAPITVEVEGYGSIVGGRKDTARESALRNAFRQAIEQVVGVMVQSKTVVQNSELLNDKVLSKSAGFIKTYSVLSEVFEADACRLKVRTTVSAVRLEKSLDDAGLLSKKLDKPRIAIIMTEQNIGNDTPSNTLGNGTVNAGISESVINDYFAKKGYNLVDRDTLVALARRSGFSPASVNESDSETALQIASSGGAEVVVVGQAVAKAGSSVLSGTNMRASQATVSAKVVDADTAQLIASCSASSNAVHVNPTAGGADALRKASRELAENLNKQLVAKWGKKVSGTRTARLTIEGVAFSEIAGLREMLQNRVNCIEETFERGYRDGTLNLDVEITGKAREMADDIAAANMDGYRFNVFSFSSNTVRVKMDKVH